MRNKLKALISIILVLVTLVSCTPAGGGDDNETPGGTTDGGTSNVTPEEQTPPKSGVVLYDKTTAYKIVIAENTSNSIIEIAEDLRAALDAMTDAEVEVVTDALGEGEEPDAGALEILIANTNRPESKEVIKDLSCSDYSIKRIGGKVVIAALSDDLLVEAINYCLGNLIVIDDDGTDKAVRLKSGFTYKSSAKDLVTSPEELSEYKIVYAFDNEVMKESAEYLSALIEDHCGVKLECITDNTVPSQKEIVLGVTTRGEAVLVKNLPLLDYVIKAVGKKIVIGASKDNVNKSAIDEFAKIFLSGTYTDGFRISGTFDSGGIGRATIKGAYDPTLAEGADLRIMSFNILAELWDPDASATLPGRDKYAADIILSYLPDVVALQENTPMWYELLEERLKGVYQYAIYKSPSKAPAYTTIMYNTHTTELIECTATIYSERNSTSSRLLTVARMRRKSDGAEFIVTNTHWDITDDRRQVQWKENADWVNDLLEQYDVPIFCAGDYNSNENDLFKKFLQSTNMTDPRFTAKTIVNPGRTTHTLGHNADPSPQTPCIDHIAVREGQEVLFYNRLTFYEAIKTSDHCPIYIDVKLNTKG